MRLLLIALFLFLPLFVGCYDAASSTPAVPAAIVGNSGKVYPREGAAHSAAAGAGVTLQLLDWDGIQRLLASHRGKVVVLDCWSTSCEPCKREFPNLVALGEKHSRDDLARVSLSFDYEGIGRPEDIAIFLRMDAQGLHGVLGHQAAELLRQQRPVGACQLIGFDGGADLQAPAIGRRQGAGSDRLRGQGSGTPVTQRHQQGEQSARHSDALPAIGSGWRTAVQP